MLEENNYFEGSQRDNIFRERNSDPFRDEQFVFLTIDEDESEGAHPIKNENPHKIRQNIGTQLKNNIPEKSADKELNKQVDLKSKKSLFKRKESEKQIKEEKSFLDLIKNAGKEVAAIFLIIASVFLLTNFSAIYSKIKFEFQNLTGNPPEEEIERFVSTSDSSEVLSLNEDENNEEINNEQITQNNEGVSRVSTQESGLGVQRNIKSSTVNSNKDLGLEKKEIPDLDIEIAPVDSRLIIPRIGENIPVIRVSSENLIKRDWAALEDEIQDALRAGVVHYPGTSFPGQDGNVVVTGHSSYFPWDPGRFKDVFALLHDVELNDRIVFYHEQKKYIYEVDDIKVVLPNDIEVLQQTERDQITLITCTPIGTNLKRLIVTAKLISEEGQTV